MGFIYFVIMLAIAYMLWRISDQMPDVIFRLSEIQRDVAELRRHSEQSDSTQDDRDDD